MYVRVHSMACLELVNLLPFFGGSDMYSIYMYKQIAYQVQRFWRSNLENFTRISPVLTLNQNRPSKTYHEAIYIYTTVYLVGGFSPTQKWKTCKYVKLDHETPRIGWTSKKLKPTNQIYIYIYTYISAHTVPQGHCFVIFSSSMTKFHSQNKSIQGWNFGWKSVLNTSNQKSRPAWRIGQFEFNKKWCDFFSHRHIRDAMMAICFIMFHIFLYPKDHWTLKTGYFEDPTPAIQVQTLPLEGPRSLGYAHKKNRKLTTSVFSRTKT